jgi:hypothetical protein
VIAITIPAITNTKIKTVVQYQSLGMPPRLAADHDGSLHCKVN